MVSAPEALRISIRDGILERKRRAGYWTKRQFVLTPTHLMYFENMEAKEPANSFATMEIMTIQKSSSDPQQRMFTLVLFKKKKEYRARSTEDRDLWMAALESVSGMKGTGVAPVKKQEDTTTQEQPALTLEEKENKADKDSGNGQDMKDIDIRALCEQMKKAFSWQIQITNLMANQQFNARKYAEDFLRKHTPQKIETHCKKLVAQKENTIEDLKEEISGNYTSFIRAADEIKTMENSVSQLKALVLESLEAPPEQAPKPEFKAVDKKAEERKQSMALDQFIHDLEVYLYERNYEQFTHLMLEHKRKETQGIESATEAQQAKIDELRHLLVEKLVDEFNSSLQTSERMHKKENHLDFLIQLGETQLATEMCLQNYSVRIALQLRHVPSYGNALNYVINFSRTFFTSLLVCYEDYEHSLAEVHEVVVWEADELLRSGSPEFGFVGKTTEDRSEAMCSVPDEDVV
eukprot:jgi/Phyca11/18501/fgenesh1_pg.PHYCAscaffold_37_\